MPGYSLTGLSDLMLAQDLRAGIADDRASLALRLAQLAEFEHRHLYLPAYPSMYRYCLEELKYSEDTACRRLAAARMARRYPLIFAAIVDGRHTVSTVLMLEHYLLPESARDLIEGSAHMSKSEVAHFLAARFPKPDVPTRVQVIPAPESSGVASTSVPMSSAPDTPALQFVGPESPALGSASLESPAPVRVRPIESAQSAQQVVPVRAHTRLAPLSPERYALQVTLPKSAHDKLRHAQALLSHSLPSGDVAEVLERALDALIERLEKRKYGATERPARARRSRNPRHISAHVRRAVRARDGDRCTHVDDRGRRCKERKFLEYDHDETVARGGEATVSNLRLRCRAHNQHAAERTFGGEFMRQKRGQADGAH